MSNSYLKVLHFDLESSQKFLHYYKVPTISYSLDTTGHFDVAKCQLYANHERHGNLTWGGLAGLDSVSRFICLVGVKMKTR